MLAVFCAFVIEDLLRHTTASALWCRLLETVPADDMKKAKEVLRVIDEALMAPAADAATSSSSGSATSSQKLILPPSQ